MVHDAPMLRLQSIVNLLFPMTAIRCMGNALAFDASHRDHPDVFSDDDVSKAIRSEPLADFWLRMLPLKCRDKLVKDIEQNRAIGLMLAVFKCVAQDCVW